MRKPSVFVALFIVLLATPAWAQRTTGAIRGTVRDATQAVLPGATVTVVNEDTGLTRTVVTNSDGAYSLSELPVGRYKVTAELPGSKSASRTNVVLRVADDLGIDFELAPGQLSEVISVIA